MRVGILGAGQLAALLNQAAFTLGINTLCYNESTNVSAAKNGELFIGNLNDKERLAAFADKVDIITVENENIETSTLDYLSNIKPMLLRLRSKPSA